NLLPAEQQDLRQVLENYLAGDLLAALAAWPARARDLSSDANSLHAALELSVGQVSETETLLARSTLDSPAMAALRELIATVRGDRAAPNRPPGTTSSELRARSYSLPALAELPGALAAAPDA